MFIQWFNYLLFLKFSKWNYIGQNSKLYKLEFKMAVVYFMYVS